jgi:hypothetical protein
MQQLRRLLGPGPRDLATITERTMSCASCTDWGSVFGRGLVPVHDSTGHLLNPMNGLKRMQSIAILDPLEESSCSPCRLEIGIWSRGVAPVHDPTGHLLNRMTVKRMCFEILGPRRILTSSCPLIYSNQ